MNNNLKIHSAFYLGLMLQRKKIDPVAMLDYFISNFNKANKNEKLSFTVLLKKDAYKEAELSWNRQKKKRTIKFL